MTTRSPEPMPAADEARDLRHNLWFVLVFNGLLFAFLFGKPVDQKWIVLIDNGAGFLGPFLSGLWYFVSGLRQRRRGRPAISRAPLFLILGALCYGSGTLIWAYHEHLLHQDLPFPSWSDLAYVAAYPCLLAGILRLPRRSLPAASRGRVVLDGLMTMTALVAFSWYFVLGPTILQGAETPLGKFLGAAYPLGDLVLLFCILVLSADRSEAASRSASRALSLGLLSVIVADTVFGYQTLQGTYATGGVVDTGWTLGYMLMGWAACALRATGERDTAATTRVPGAAPLGNLARNAPVLWRSLLPYALVPAVVALFVFTLTTRGDLTLKIGVYVSAALLVGLLLLRQVLALYENRHVYRLLNDAYTELEAQNASLAAANARLESLATTDGMTGLANHRMFQDRLRAERARENGSLALLLLDVDHFKRYNDCFGHPAGDDVLCTLGCLLRQAVRDGDLAARYGGEEFAILLPGTSAATALAIAERIRAAVAAHPFSHTDVTVSIGAALACGAPDSNDEDLVVRADAALYAAKRAGRNRVVLSEAESGPSLSLAARAA